MPILKPVPLQLGAPAVVVAFGDDERTLLLLDQRALPAEERYVVCRTLGDVVDAIRTLTVRGAPAIGVAAACGLVVALEAIADERAGRDADAATRGAAARAALDETARTLAAARPTAVNLAWALRRVTARAALAPDDTLLATLRTEAQAIHDEDRAMCAAIGAHGATLLTAGMRVLTVCNAGALATAGIGTALAPLYVAHARGLRPEVYACETRPLLQGARLTAWELGRAGIPVRVLPDGAAASLIASGRVDAVIVGADRIAANGDAANKIGTYAVALAAAAHDVPFYVAAPSSTIDPDTPHGDAIPIEHRHRDELASLGERTLLPPHADVHNPAFDVTPRALIRAYVTERGVVHPPFDVSHPPFDDTPSS